MLPFGDYRVYAVANMDDLLTAHAEDIKTVTGLRDIKAGVVGPHERQLRDAGLFHGGES